MDAGSGAGLATRLEDGIWQIDLNFQGRSGVVAAYLLAGAGEVVLIETGPSSTLPALLAGIAAAGFAPEELTGLLVTHIHLDHAGAAGVLIRRYPHLTVGVHPVGAPHLIDPARLLASATRIRRLTSSKVAAVGSGLRSELEADRATRWLAGNAMILLSGRSDLREPTQVALGTRLIHVSQLALLPGWRFKAAEAWRQLLDAF